MSHVKGRGEAGEDPPGMSDLGDMVGASDGAALWRPFVSAGEELQGQSNFREKRERPARAPCTEEELVYRQRHKERTASRTLAKRRALVRVPTLMPGPLPNVTTQEGPHMSTPPTEEAHCDDSSSVQLDLDDQPGPSETSGQSVPLTQSQATTELPPSGNTSTALTQWAHTSVPRTRQAAVCPPLQRTQANPPPQQQQGPGGSGSGHTVQGTEAQGNRGTGRAAVQ
ncbi:hypothetical protein NDU88_001515 [Pleurodeles waltl]|uniref:Uncharacterized protein n=1 Tax=Pleurodeles waltl TaxID=8319 RepID=A0AAV7RA65_PLEWA|nr:hypothetical protein NDU88_001515 [Pleurodeles waltl]